MQKTQFAGYFMTELRKRGKKDRFRLFEPVGGLCIQIGYRMYTRCCASSFSEVNFPFPDKSGRFSGFPVESLCAVVSIRSESSPS